MFKERIKSIFSKTQYTSGHQRLHVNSSFLIGFDSLGRESIIYESYQIPKRTSSSKTIDINTYKRDNIYLIEIILKDKNYLDLFIEFASDLATYIESIENKKRTEELINRYNRWIYMFSIDRTKHLTDSEEKGLLGELVFIRDYPSSKYGLKESILSWVGPEKHDKDFVFENFWYEVKTKSTGSDLVQISSIEQLDGSISGFLGVVYINVTSSLSQEMIDLRTVVEDIELRIDDFNLMMLFKEKLTRSHYDSSVKIEYNSYELHKIKIFEITEDFPKITRDIIDTSIVNATYQISLSSIERFLIYES